MNAARLRWLFWIGALAAIGFLAFNNGADISTETVESALPAGRGALKPYPASLQQHSDELQWRRLESRLAATTVGADLFAPRQWVQQPSRAAAEIAIAPVRPVIPAAPFRYLGRLDTGEGSALVMLSDGIRVYTVVPGQAINALWRLDREESQALQLTYLPLDASQVIMKSRGAPQNEELQGAF